MSASQLVQPDLSVTDGPGWCLRFTQNVWGAPARHNSAWDAWLATTAKHDATEDLPNVAVICWFEHWGSYGNPPTYANWGHVVTYVPGRGWLSSPTGRVGGPAGQVWLGTIAEVERTFNCKYVGWSEDINGLRIAESKEPPKPKVEDMAQGAFYRNPGGGIVWQEKPNTVLIPIDLTTWTGYASNGNKYADVSQSAWDGLVKKFGTAPTPPAGSGGGTITLPDYNITLSGKASKN